MVFLWHFFSIYSCYMTYILNLFAADIYGLG